MFGACDLFQPGLTKSRGIKKSELIEPNRGDKRFFVYSLRSATDSASIE